jgi:hypothetical protein
MTERTTGGRDELSQRLRTMFKATGMSTTRAAELLTADGVPTSQSKVSRTLNGRVAADPDFIDRLCTLLGASREGRDELVKLAREIRKGNRRLVLGRDTAAAQARIGKFERESTLVRAVAVTSIPGELQTAPYVRTIFDTEAAVRQRLLNQAILDEETGTRRFQMLIAESALGWTPLPPADMAAQVDHIAAAMGRRNLRVGVLPWGQPLPVLPQHSWYLFDSRLVVTGGATYALDLTDPDDVAVYATITDELERVAVYGGAARAILGRVAERYRSHAGISLP